MDHEKLDCYQELLTVAEDLAKRIAKWPRGHGYLADQLNRAMASSILNVAEGNGKRSSAAERRRFFEISRGSIAEVGAGIDLSRAYGLMSSTDQESLKSRLKAAYVKIGALP